MYRRTRLDRPESGMVGQALICIVTADENSNLKGLTYEIDFENVNVILSM
jgi:hypothetical protein